MLSLRHSNVRASLTVSVLLGFLAMNLACPFKDRESNISASEMNKQQLMQLEWSGILPRDQVL